MTEVEELPNVTEVAEVKARIAQWLREDYPTAQFSWYEPPYVEDRLRLIIKCYGKLHHIGYPRMSADGAPRCN